MLIFHRHFIVIIIFVLHLHKAHSFVVTKYQTETITAYLNHVRKFDSDEATVSFLKINIPEYCEKLRKSYTYRSVIISANRRPEPQSEVPAITDHVPDDCRETERNQGGIQTRKFRIENLNQTLTFHSFQCFNRERVWFITPAFLPHSAFLFELEIRFRNLVEREINGNDEIPARLTAIIDERGTRHPRHEAGLLYRYLMATNFSGRDKLCDYNRILQFRLCVLTAVEFQNDFWSESVYPNQFIHESGSSNVYYDTEERDANCRPVLVKKDDGPDISNTSSYYSQKMLYCSVHIARSGLFFFYLGSISTKFPIICLQRKFISNGTKWKDNIYVHKIPLLKHVDNYKKLLKDIDI